MVRTPDPPPAATTRWLLERGVRVPRLGPAGGGVYLCQDFGDRHLSHDPRPAAYEQVMAFEERIGTGTLPPGHPNARLALDEALFRKELRMFREWYVQAFRRRAHAPVEADRVDALCARLAVEASLGPARLQHRDFHSRNVLLPAEGGPVLLDHQDLRRGPLFYDLASLLTDAYLDLPGDIRARLEAEAEALGARHGLTRVETRERLRITALQRVLKALGTFGHQLARFGNRRYEPAARRARPIALVLLSESPAYEPLKEWIA
ncbi:MAG: phosphotransferase [Planctomycetota bacterium]